MKKLSSYKPKTGYVLVLKSVKPDMTAGYSNGFLWPVKGKCVASDWKPTQECGNGLHGWKWGEGDAGLRVTEPGAKWLVLSVLESEIIDLSGKVKFPECEVVFVGEMAESVSIIQAHEPAGNKCIFGTATAGYRGTATAGSEGIIIIQYYDKTTETYKRKMAMVDRVTILPGIKYRLNDAHDFEPVNETVA